jgi:hypothetical protein
MHDPERSTLDGPDIELARWIDVACHRFEADLERRTPAARRE